MVSWRLLCTRVASAIAAKGLSRGGLTQSGFRWAVRPPGSDDERFEYDTCVALHTWQADAQAGDLEFEAGARIAITSRSVPGARAEAFVCLLPLDK